MQAIRKLRVFSEAIHVKPSFEVDGVEHRMYLGFRSEPDSGIVNLTWIGPCPCASVPEEAPEGVERVAMVG